MRYSRCRKASIRISVACVENKWENTFYFLCIEKKKRVYLFFSHGIERGKKRYLFLIFHSIEQEKKNIFWIFFSAVHP